MLQRQLQLYPRRPHQECAQSSSLYPSRIQVVPTIQALAQFPSPPLILIHSHSPSRRGAGARPKRYKSTQQDLAAFPHRILRVARGQAALLFAGARRPSILCPKNVGGTTQRLFRVSALSFPISSSPSHTFLRSASSKLQNRGRGSLSQPACEPDLLLLLYCLAIYSTHSPPRAIAGDSLIFHIHLELTI